MHKFKIVCTGWRCEEFIDRCLDSILQQSFKNYHVAVVIDEVTPHSNYSNILSIKYHQDVEFMFNPIRMGKVANFIMGLSMMHPSDDDVILDVDLDDYLEPGALSIIATEYDKFSDLLLTYGSYRCESGKPARFNGKFYSNNFRREPWKASHLKTFKYKLFKKITAHDLKGKNNRWLMTCADVAIMYPMLEMAGQNRIKHIRECLYCYNDLNPLNDHKVAKIEQKQTTKYLRSLPPYKQVNF